MKKLTLFTVLVVIAGASFAASTPKMKIEKVQFKASSGAYYIYNSEGWGVCNNTKFVEYAGPEVSKQIFISHALAAHMASKDVQFSGTCTSSNNYLGTDYIYVY